MIARWRREWGRQDYEKTKRNPSQESRGEMMNAAVQLKDSPILG